MQWFSSVSNDHTKQEIADASRGASGRCDQRRTKGPRNKRSHSQDSQGGAGEHCIDSLQLTLSVDDYQVLVTRMADSCFSIKRQPNQSKAGNQLVLLWLLADVEAVQLARKRPRPYSDREAVKKLMSKEPFKARWGGMNTKTLCNWLSAARASFEHSGQRPVPKIS
jgi:hypothetical protein